MAIQDSLIKPPLQRRSQESLERVLNAGFEVLREQGFEGFTLHEVSRRANVSIGSIYSRVPNREALIMAIYERTMNWTEENQVISRDGTRYDLAPRDRIELIVTDTVTTMLARGDVLRVFMKQAPLNREIWERGSEKSHRTARVFSDAVLERREDIGHPDPELAVDVAFRIIYNTIARWITHGSKFESSRNVSEKDLVRELAHAVAAYLL